MKIDLIRYYIIATFLLYPLFFTSCITSKTFSRGAIGVSSGAVIGGVIGSRYNNTVKGAIMGAVIGGTGGAVVGKYMDKQAQELEGDLKGAQVERIGEGIKITFDSGILFDFDSSLLTIDAQTIIKHLAETLKKYDDTDILIEGNTDSKGSKKYNQNLSEKRASSVAEYLAESGVSNILIIKVGYGENNPVADNNNEAGRAQNRRVVVAIYLDKKLKKAAMKGELDRF